MCTACVAQGIVYVGGAVGSLRLMAARAEHKRQARQGEAETDDATVSAAPSA